METLTTVDTFERNLVMPSVTPEVKWSKELWETCQDKDPQRALEIVCNRSVTEEASKDYVSMPTIELLAELLEQGLKFTWRVDFYKGDVKEYTGSHRVTVVPDISLSEELDELGSLAIYLYNSSDRKMRFGVFAGWLEWACLNGCFSGEILFDEEDQGLFIRQKHIHTTLAEMKKKVQNVAKSVKDYLNSERKREFTHFMNKMIKTPISEEMELEMTRKILEKRLALFPWHSKKFKEKDGTFAIASDIKDYASQARELARPEHRGQTFHKAMQRLQEASGANPKDKSRKEHIPKGLKYELRFKDDDGNNVTDMRTVHQIQLDDPNKISEMNLYITDLFKEYLEKVPA